MTYTIKALADLSGVTPKTLRHYHKIGLLIPKTITEAGYRIYGQEEVDRLQQILFYRTLGLGLSEIKKIMEAPDFNEEQVLKTQYEKLVSQRDGLNQLIETVKKTISARKGEITMTDQEKFEGFKKRLVAENERQYGKEIRDAYGSKQIEESNEKLLAMTKEEHEALTQLTEQLKEALKKAVKTKDPAGEAGQQVAVLHKKWLSYYWSSYSKKAHAGLAMLYTQDERFTAYYEEIAPGATEFLRDAILIYTK